MVCEMTSTLKIVFDTPEQREAFVSWFCDGGSEQEYWFMPEYSGCEPALYVNEFRYHDKNGIYNGGDTIRATGNYGEDE